MVWGPLEVFGDAAGWCCCTAKGGRGRRDGHARGGGATTAVAGRSWTLAADTEDPGAVDTKPAMGEADLPGPLTVQGPLPGPLLPHHPAPLHAPPPPAAPAPPLRPPLLHLRPTRQLPPAPPPPGELTWRSVSSRRKHVFTSINTFHFTTYL